MLLNVSYMFIVLRSFKRKSTSSDTIFSFKALLYTENSFDVLRVMNKNLLRLKLKHLVFIWFHSDFHLISFVSDFFSCIYCMHFC